MAGILKACIGQNRMWDIEGIKTTCLSKYRKVKHHRPPWKLLETKKLKNMYYDLTYAAPIQKGWSFQDAIRFWEEENKRRGGIGAAESTATSAGPDE